MVAKELPPTKEEASSEEAASKEAEVLKIPRPPEVLTRKGSERTMKCQVCTMGVRSRDFPDMYSEEEGRQWRLCASCVTGLWPSLSVSRVPRSEHVKIGKSSDEFLWELNPRACVAVRTSPDEVWPTAYAAIAAEMFDTAEIRAEVYNCFDADEVDQVLRRTQHLVRADWRFVRVAVTRKILKLKVKCHPLMDRLLYTIAGKRLSFDGGHELVLGDDKMLANICMEILDDVARKNRS